MVIQDISNKDMGFVYISRIPHKPKQTNQIVKPYISNHIYPNMDISQFGQYERYIGLKGLKVFLDMMVLPRIPLINIKPIEIVKGEI